MTNPNDPQLIEKGIRRKVVLEGENFYFYISENAIFCTVPRENDPNMSGIRQAMEDLCEEITARMGGDRDDSTRID